MFADRLIEKIVEKDNPSVMGLDPRLNMIPRCIMSTYYKKGVGRAVFEFNKALIDATADVIPAIKLQIAFYEALGIDGLRAYRQTTEYAAGKGLLTIGDVKRGDISSTAEAYRHAHFYGYFKCDAITLNPFLGYDSIAPFLRACREDGKGVFVLVKTSNPSSKELQNIRTKDGYLYQYLGRKVQQWGEDLTGKYGYSSVGAVIGATGLDELKDLRNMLPHTLFLVPGYGAQGAGGAEVAYALDDKGLGAIINSSRALMGAYLRAKEPEKITIEELKQYTLSAALHMRDDINGAVLGLHKGSKKP